MSLNHYQQEKNIMKSSIMAVSLAGILLSSGLVFAQQHSEHHQRPEGPPPQQMMMQMGEEHAMMGMGMMSGPSPMMILKQREALGLSDAQVERLQSLEEQLEKAHQAHMKEVMPLRHSAMEALKGEQPNLASYEAALKKLSGPHIAMQVELARVSQEALKVLSAEQRSNVRYGMRLMREEGMVGSGRCPMMMEHPGGGHS